MFAAAGSGKPPLWGFVITSVVGEDVHVVAAGKAVGATFAGIAGARSPA